MATIEGEDSEIHQNDDVENNNLQPFFVLHKASSRKAGRKSTGKTRRKIDLSETEAVEGVDNEQVFDSLRLEAFDYVWSKTASTIKDVLRNINLHVFNEIERWVRDSFDAISSQGMRDFAKVICSYPILSDAKSKQLFTGLVFTRNIEFVDDLLTFADLGEHLRSHGCHVANLSSLDFSAKNGICGSIRSLLSKFLMVSLDAADISILASWYAEQGNYESPVVVIIEDLERCCGTVLSDFILMLSDWVVKIPVILIMGVATTTDAPRNILSSNALQCLSPCKFMLGSPAERLDAIISAVLVRQCTGLSVGHKVATFLRNCFLRQDGTLYSLVRGLKIATILHFSREPLSYILNGWNCEDNNQLFWSEKPEALSEVRLKQAFDLPSYTRNKVAEPNGEFLKQGLLELKKSQNLWTSVLLCLYEAAKYHKISLLDLYCEALDPGLDMENIFKMPSSDYGVVGQPSKLHVGGLICRAIRKVRDLSPVTLCQLLESWEKLSEGNVEIQEKVKELQTLSKVYYKDLMQESTDISRRHTTRNNIDIVKDVKPLNEKAAALLGSIVRDYMQPIELGTFHEIVCFKNVEKLQSTLVGDPRRRIQADLLEPHKFLKCSCCRKSGNAPLPTMHDTSIMYTLAQEHGDLINLHDWYKTFKAAVCPTIKGNYKFKQSPSPKKRKHAIEPQHLSEASLQARFCRAVMELQITGLLRMPSKRRPDYVQRVAFGL